MPRSQAQIHRANTGPTSSGPFPAEDALSALFHSLLQDPLLSDLPPDPTLQEIDHLIALEQGAAVRISILRGSLAPLSVIVHQSATVAELKQLVQTAATRANQGSKRKINWRYIWNRYCLVFEGQKLAGEKTRLDTLGIRAGSQIRFVRKNSD
ncbi:uncharacterized protein VTP21DRAFT_7616 [Calcarisporiella thermophila]|uniref:uncharacterized protein n=1 Tax=Calcarisporiella thermophila TaxID=911321 RepID=UPI003743CE15